MVTTTLQMLKKAGAKLILAEPALEEIFTHMHASLLEFENYYADIEPLVDEVLVQSIDRVIIRAYFYARLGINTASDRKAPNGWRSYIGQFCSYEDLRRTRNRTGLRLYLCDKFGLDFEAKEEMSKGIDRDELAKLMAGIAKERSGPGRRSRGVRRADLLAYNDALHVLRVYAKRREVGENAAPNPFGFRTWWLTHERAVQRASSVTLGANRARFIMRPEFALNYIALLPSNREIANSYQTIFPTILGVSLSKRAPENLLHNVLSSARKAFAVDNSRAKAMLNEFSDRLKSDQLRLYETDFSNQ